MAKIVEYIYTEERRGLGEEGNPFRTIKQLWTKQGELIAEEGDIEFGDSIFLKIK